MRFSKRVKLIIGVEVALILLIPLVAFIILSSMQEKFFFYPKFDESSYNELKQDSNFEEVKITLENGNTLSGWFAYNNDIKEKSPLVIWFFGNAQNASSEMLYLRKSGGLNHLKGVHVLMMDYPGYGLSEGEIKNDDDFLSPTIEIYDWAKNNQYVDENNIIVLGYSIGTGAATYLCSKRDAKGLVLLAPYDEALSLYNKYFNIFYGPLENLTTFKLRSKEYAKSIKIPVLIFSSQDDEVVSYEFSKKLSSNFENLEEFVTIENTLHSMYFSKDRVWDRISDFIKDKIDTNL